MDKNPIGQIKSMALDALFPKQCFGCGKEGAWLCDGCLEKIPLLTFQVCPVCEKYIIESGKPCQKCRPDSLVTALTVAASYQEKIISKLVHFLKYNFIADLHIPLGKLLVKSLLKSKLPIPNLIIPVPLHPRRLRWRGFNQSELLANYLSANLTPGFPIPVLNNVLLRKKYTAPQMSLKNYQTRRANIKNAFAIQNKTGLSGKSVLIIDDVATTGSTLFECARVLRKNGARRIYACVIARQQSQKQARS